MKYVVQTIVAGHTKYWRGFEQYASGYRDTFTGWSLKIADAKVFDVKDDASDDITYIADFYNTYHYTVREITEEELFELKLKGI